MTIDRGLFHLLVALLLLPGYYVLGASFKILLIPYVLFLLSQRTSEMFPALLVHFLPGTVVSFAILIGCPIFVASRYTELDRYRALPLWIASFFPVPWLAVIATYNAIVSETAIIEIINHMSIYLGIFPFFYGLLVSADYQPRVGNRILWVLSVAVIYQLTGLHEGFIRYVSFTYAVMSCLLIYILTYRGKLEVPFALKIFPFLLLVAVGVRWATGSFTMFTVAFLAGALTWIHVNFHSKYFSYWVQFLGVSVLLSTVYILWIASDRIFERSERLNIYDIESIYELVPAIEFKAFGDRKPLWDATWKSIIDEYHILPPSEPTKIKFEQKIGDDVEVSYGAHNIALELIRNYGFLTGGLAIFIYLSIFVRLGILFRCGLNDPLLHVFGFSCVATGTLGGIFGHYVLINSFSFLLFGLAGLVVGIISSKSVADNY